MVVSNPAVVEHKELGKITDALWPHACPSKHEDHVLSIVCGNTHLQWALHQGVHGKFLPQLFWRTPALSSDEIDAGDPCCVLERYLPGGGHDLVFGSQNAPADKAQATKASAARRIPLLSVYVVSTNADNEAGVEFLFRDIPCRMYRLQAADFYSMEEGVYPGMGIDRLANLKAASKFYPYPVMVIDGGTAMTYTAADAKGNIVGGGIFPGFASIYRSLYDYTGALPLIAQEEMNKLIGEAIASKTPLSLFAKDTKSAMITTGVKAMAEVCWGAVQEFKDKILKDAPVDGAMEQDKEVQGNETAADDKEKDENRVFTICLTGGDGDIIARLLDTDHNGILSSNVPAGARDGVEIQKHKHLAHYGIGQVLDEKTTAGQSTKSEDDKIREEIIGQRVAKSFKIRTDEKIFRGSVAAVADGETLEKDWFYVRYDDGDTEHLSITALYDGLMMYREVGEEEIKESEDINKKDAAKKQEQAEETAKLLAEKSAVVKTYSETPASERKQAKKRVATQTKSAPPLKVQKVKGARKKEDPLFYVGQRVAKYFGNEVYFGTVRKFIPPTTKKDVDLWHIVYDDDDQEDYDHKDLRKGIALYKSNQLDDKVSRVTAVAGIGEDDDDDKPAEDAMEAEPALEDDAAEPQDSEIQAPALEEEAAVVGPSGDDAGFPVG